MIERCAGGSAPKPPITGSSGHFSPLNFCCSSVQAGGMQLEGLVEGRQLASNEGEGL